MKLEFIRVESAYQVERDAYLLRLDMVFDGAPPSTFTICFEQGQSPLTVAEGLAGLARKITGGLSG